MNYRPITDMWILARPKVPYYGAYPNGFLERALPLIGHSTAPTLHVCGGSAKSYPAQRLVQKAFTLDLDPDLKPNFLRDACEPLPLFECGYKDCLQCEDGDYLTGIKGHAWPQILIDPPYTLDDADHYAPGRQGFPVPNRLLRNALQAVGVGGRVGMLHYVLPQPPKEGARFVACVGVIVGYNNRMRCFSVFERTR